MASQLQLERLRPASLGMDVLASPEYVDPQRAPVVTNFLCGRDGKLAMRGPLRLASLAGATIDAVNPYAGVFAYDSKLLVSQSLTAQRIIDLTHFTNTTVAVPSGDTTTAPGRSSARHGPNTFGTSQAAHAGVATTTAMLLRWSGTGAATKLTSNAPQSPAAVASHLARLFVLGGTVPGTTVAGGGYHGNGLYWTIEDTTTTTLGDLLTHWKDPVSGNVNQIILDGDPTDSGVALARLNNNLVILRQRSLMIASGGFTNLSDVSIRSVSATGCIDPAAVLTIDDMLYFMSPDGFMRFDGATVTNLSRRILPDIGAQLGPDMGWSLARMSGDYLMLTCSYAMKAWLFHIPSASWARCAVATAIDSENTVRWAGRTDTSPYVWAGDKLWLADALTQPESVAGAKGREGGSYMDDTGSHSMAWSPINATWQSRVTRLATPMSKSQLSRIFVDYSFHGAGFTGFPEVAWTVDLLDGQGNLIQSLGALPVATNAQRQRAVFDCNAEVQEVQVSVHWAGETETSLSAKPDTPEIYDVWVAFQPARQR